MDALCSYLPASILSYILEREGTTLTPPLRQTYKTSVLFADISGYTALCEAVASRGAGGDEYLARHLNSYFEQLVKIMSSQGGDVFKFAGDAVIVLWPPSADEDITTLTRRAAQCALEIKRGLQNVKLAEGIELSVKVGVGVGEVSILHVGGVFGRMEYVAVGPPLLQAFGAEHHCEKPDVIVSPEAWELIHDQFEAEINDRHAFLKKCVLPLKKMSVFKTTSASRNIKEEVLKNVGQYVPSAVLPFIAHHEEKWASELRRITVLFVNLGLKERDMNEIATNANYIHVIHDVLKAVQTAVYKYEGSLNKFLMDDKGSTLIAVFGLPPLAHEDDSVRGILSALAICAKLAQLGYKPAIGVTTGSAFAGVVGSRGRREYSVLGDTVNLSARLMQHATKQGGGVICDTATQYAARNRLHFEDNGHITVKGKIKPVLIWQPYSKVLAPFYQSKDAAPAANSHDSHPPSPTNSIPPPPSDPSVALPTGNVVLVDDETLHLRSGKSAPVDPSQLVRSVDSPPAPTPTPPPVNSTADVLDLSTVKKVVSGASTSETVDQVAAEQSKVSESIKPSLSINRRSSLLNPDGSSIIPKENVDKKLMLDIHNFQMEGSISRHFALLRSRKESRGSLVNSMDASINTIGSPKSLASPNVHAAARVADINIPTTGVVRPASNSTSSAFAFNSHLSWFASAAIFDNVNEGVAPSADDFARCYPDRAMNKRVRGVRVILPDGVGALVLSTIHLESILQLKEELSILCRKRMLLPLDACNAGFFLALENDKLLDAPQRGSKLGSADPTTTEIDSLRTSPTALIDDVLGPILDRQRAATKKYQETHRAAIGSIELFSPSNVIASALSPTPNSTIIEEPNSPNSNSTNAPLLPVVTQGDLLTLCLCRNSPDYLIDVLPRKFHDILLHAVEVRLLDEKRGGTIILEGDVGLGKTHLMMSALSVAQRDRPETFSLLCTVANPFEMNKPLSSWRDIFLSAIDNEIDRLEAIQADTYPHGSSGSQSQVRANRRKFVESKLQLRRSGGRESLHLYASVLNDVLQLDFSETECTRELDQQARIAHAMHLLIVLMQIFTNPASAVVGSGSLSGLSPRFARLNRSGSLISNSSMSSSNSSHHPSSATPPPSIIVCIDDAVFLDSASWQLALQMSRQVSGLLLILSTRPINRTYQAAFATGGVPKDYSDLLTDPQTTHLVMRPRTDNVIYQIACEAFASENDVGDNVVQMLSSNSSSAPLINCPKKDQLLPTMPQPLAHLILKKAHGSPLVALEIVYNLKKDKLVTVDSEATLDSNGVSTLKLRIDPSLNVGMIHNNPLVPVPITLQNILGCRIDRLTHSQRMILKVGSVVGDEWPFSIVLRCYPLAIDGPIEAVLRKEVAGLVELGILNLLTEPGDPFNDEHDENVKYTFNAAFMRELVLSRMLENQKTVLEEKVSEARLELFKKKHERVINSLVPVGGTRAGSIAFITPVLASVLHVRDNPPFSLVKNEKSNESADDDSTWNPLSSTPQTKISAASKVPLEYRLRYFALCANMLFGWMTEEAFLERKDPISIYSLEDASTTEDPSHELGFAIRCLVCLDRGQYALNPVIVRFAALNEKDYETWGMKLHEFVEEKLTLPSDEPTKPLPEPSRTPQLGALSGIVEEEEEKSGAGAVQYQVNPLHNSAPTPGTPVQKPQPTRSPLLQPHTSFSIPAAVAASSAEEKPVSLDVSALTPAERETWGKKFISAVENRMAPQIIPSQLLYVRKHREENGKSSGSLFSSEWKQRHVTLIDEALVLRDKKFGDSYPWTKPSQAFSLQVGTPVAVVPTRDSFDSSRKVYKVTVEVDLWMKAGIIAWSRRSVVLGCATFEQAKTLADRLNELIFKNQVALSQAKVKHQRASTWGNFKAGSNSRINANAPGAGPPGAVTPASTPVALTRPPVQPHANGSTRPMQPRPHPQAGLRASKSTAADSGSESDRKLRASQRQMSGTSNGPTYTTNGPPHIRTSGSFNEGPQAPPSTPQDQAASPKSAGLPFSPNNLPYDNLVVPAGPHSAGTPISPMGGGSASPMYPTTPASPMYPTTPTPTPVPHSNGFTPPSGEDVSVGRASPNPSYLTGPEADRQIDQLFLEALQSVSSHAKTSDAAANGHAEQQAAKQILLQLRSKVKALNRTPSLQPRVSGSQPSTPNVREREADNEDSNSSNTNSGIFGFNEMMSTCDLDDTTKSWLQLNWTNDVPVTDVSVSSATPSKRPSGIQTNLIEEKSEEKEEHVMTPPATYIVVSKSNGSSASASRSISPLTINIPRSLSESSFGDLTSWEWNIFDHATDSSLLLPIVYHIFHEFKFLELFSISPDIFHAWAGQVHVEYFENPFHNFYHAVDVLQTVCVMLTRFGAGEYLTTLDQFALCMAALCHDLRHPGLNNLYHIHARTPLALLYNDQSVLEHHHAASTFRLLEKPAFNILSSLSQLEYRSVRSRLTLGILATDMSSHLQVIEKFNTFLDESTKMRMSGVGPSGPIDPNAHPSSWLSDGHRGVIFNVVLHSCDISNPSKPWVTQRKWSDAVLQEFLHQGDMERAKGIPISPNCDRLTTDQALLSLNFIDFIVAPIFVSLRQLLPAVHTCCRIIKENRTEWATIFTASISSNPRLDSNEKDSELARAKRRTESFHEIIVDAMEDAPTMSRRFSLDQLHSAEHESTTPVTPQQNDRLTIMRSASHGSNISAVSTSPPLIRHSSLVTPPLAGRYDPRRNSLAVLKQFVTANSKVNKPTTGSQASLPVSNKSS